MQCKLNLGLVSTLFSLCDSSYLRRWAQVLAAASGSMLSWIMQAAISTARPLSPMWASAHAWYMLPSHSTGPCWHENVRPGQSYRDAHHPNHPVLLTCLRVMGLRLAVGPQPNVHQRPDLLHGGQKVVKNKIPATLRHNICLRSYFLDSLRLVMKA